MARKGTVVISRALAEKFIEQVTAYTEYNVNIMDESGTIIASRDPERVGQYHEIAYRIVKGAEEIVDTSKLGDFPGVLPGINMVIQIDGKREGVVGVTGSPDEIRPVALIIKMAIESMLRYERQQEAVRLRENRKERFLHLLTEVENPDPEEVRRLAEELGYPEERIRIPILAQLDGIEAGDFLERIRSSELHTAMDVSIALNQRHVIIFKSMPDKKEDLFSNYKYLIGEYLGPVLRWMKETGVFAHFFVGSFQDSYFRYYYAYRHCRWLQDHIKPVGTALFFYDYVGAYLRQIAPMHELTHIFYIYEKRMTKEKKEGFLETFDCLLRNNFNFNRTAKELYVHKNTLVYRYNKWKELLNIDPLANSADRSFIEAFHSYLERSAGLKKE